MGLYTHNDVFKEMIEHSLDAQGHVLCGRPVAWCTQEIKPGFHVVQCAKCMTAKAGVTKLPDQDSRNQPEFRNAGKHPGGRPRKFASNAERQRAYRQRQNAAVGGSEKNSGLVSEANSLQFVCRQCQRPAGTPYTILGQTVHVMQFGDPAEGLCLECWTKAHYRREDDIHWRVKERRKACDMDMVDD